VKVVIDTSSLISLVRYYLPFDKNNVLFEFIKAKVLSGEIIVMDKVYDECKYTSQGIVIQKLNYLNDKKLHYKTGDLLPFKKFYNMVENQFINGSVKNILTPVEFENRKNVFLDSADVKILLYGLKFKDTLLDRPLIISEETETSNDNKSFKKLPAICRIVGLEVKTLPGLLEFYEGIDVEFR
jgi:hypothetical protein